VFLADKPTLAAAVGPHCALVAWTCCSWHCLLTALSAVQACTASTRMATYTGTRQGDTAAASLTALRSRNTASMYVLAVAGAVKRTAGHVTLDDLALPSSTCPPASSVPLEVGLHHASNNLCTGMRTLALSDGSAACLQPCDPLADWLVGLEVLQLALPAAVARSPASAPSTAALQVSGCLKSLVHGVQNVARHMYGYMCNGVACDHTLRYACILDRWPSRTDSTHVF
jgi:hypothetical protein